MKIRTAAESDAKELLEIYLRPDMRRRGIGRKNTGN